MLQKLPLYLLIKLLCRIPGVPSRLAKATLKGLGPDGLTEQSAKL